MGKKEPGKRGDPKGPRGRAVVPGVVRGSGELTVEWMGRPRGKLGP